MCGILCRPKTNEREKEENNTQVLYRIIGKQQGQPSGHGAEAATLAANQAESSKMTDRGTKDRLPAEDCGNN